MALNESVPLLDQKPGRGLTRQEAYILGAAFLIPPLILLSINVISPDFLWPYHIRTGDEPEQWNNCWYANTCFARLFQGDKGLGTEQEWKASSTELKCDVTRTSFMREPFDAISNYHYAVLGMYTFLCAKADAEDKEPRSVLRARPGISVLFGVTAIAQGFFGGWYHMSELFLGAQLDNFAIVWMVGSAVLLAVWRLFYVFTGTILPVWLYAILQVVLLVGTWAYEPWAQPHDNLVCGFAGTGYILVIVLAIMQCKFPVYVLISFVLLCGGFYTYKLDLDKGVCEAEFDTGWFSLHSIWHYASLIALGLLYLDARFADDFDGEHARQTSSDIETSKPEA